MTFSRLSVGATLLVTFTLLGVARVEAVDVMMRGRLQLITDGQLLKILGEPVTLDLPPHGGSSDPTVVGASLKVVDTLGAGSFVVNLPSARWAALGNPPGSKGYRYRRAAGDSSPCRTAILRSNIVKVICEDDQMLNPPLFGDAGVTLSLGAYNYCAQFGGRLARNGGGLFLGRDADAPASCPTCCGGAGFMSFTITDDVVGCGLAIDANGNLVRVLECNKVYGGGGGATGGPLPARIPDQTRFVMGITQCVDQAAALGPATAVQTGSTQNCSDAGCPFGAPFPVPNTSSPPSSTCVMNSLTAPGSGAADCVTGGARLSLSLRSEVFTTGDLLPDAGIQPCPLCNGGTCRGGPNNGMSCVPGTGTSGEAFPTSSDCPPDPSYSIGATDIGVALSSGTMVWTATPSGSQPRVFCGYCRDADDSGTFQNPANRCVENGVAVGPGCVQPFESCQQRTAGAFGPNGGSVKTISVSGTSGAGLLTGPVQAKLVNVFCIPPTFDASADAQRDFPGPGAAGVRAELRLCDSANPCP
jgi:hypothetical protein